MNLKKEIDREIEAAKQIKNPELNWKIKTFQIEWKTISIKKFRKFHSK